MSRKTAAATTVIGGVLGAAAAVAQPQLFDAGLHRSHRCPNLSHSSGGKNVMQPNGRFCSPRGPAAPLSASARADVEDALAWDFSAS